MNVWVVEVGEYEDRGVIAVAATLEAAKAVCQNAVWARDDDLVVRGTIKHTRLGYSWDECVEITRYEVVE